MIKFLDIVFLQLSSHICGNNDKEQLEIIQWQIQHRINYLKKSNLNTNNDTELFQYYEIHRQIQNCIAQSPNDNIEILSIMLVVFIGIVIFVVYMVKKVRTLENS